MSVDVYMTSSGGTGISAAIANSQAKMGWEPNRCRPPDQYPVQFIDFPFNTGGMDWDAYREIVAEEKPEIAVAPDIQDTASAADTLAFADQLSEDAESVVVVPKEVHPSFIPERFRIGIPAQSNWGDGAEWPKEAYRGLEVHVLGGSPRIALEITNHADVRSYDSSSVNKASRFGGVWENGGWTDYPKSTDHYDRVQESLTNVVEDLAMAVGYGCQFVSPDLDEFTLKHLKSDVASVLTDREFLDVLPVEVGGLEDTRVVVRSDSSYRAGRIASTLADVGFLVTRTGEGRPAVQVHGRETEVTDLHRGDLVHVNDRAGPWRVTDSADSFPWYGSPSPAEVRFLTHARRDHVNPYAVVWWNEDREPGLYTNTVDQESGVSDDARWKKYESLNRIARFGPHRAY